MSVIHIDFESFYDEAAGISLKKMALLAYLRVAPIIGFSFAVDHGPFEWVPANSADFLPTLQDIDDFCQEPGNILNAYNTPFDARCGVYGRLEPYGEPFGMRWPLLIHDAMELAMAAYPHCPGGYSLRNVAQWMHLPPKLSIDDAKKGRCTWEAYCNRDGELLQSIYYRVLDRLSPEEIYYSENCNKVRGLSYQINPETVQRSLTAFTENTRLGVEAATEFLSNYARDGEDLSSTIFGGYEEGKVRSVKAKALKELLVGALGFDTTSTSLKKINPAHLAARPDVATLLTATTRANKGLYYQKRAQALMGTTEVPMEKGYFRAATGRTSAPTTGRGVNVANLTKKDKSIAKPLREMLALPDHLCYVQADASNAEYRCLLEGTPVLTDSGWKAIESVTSVDKVWDGVEWVSQGGAICQGTREVLCVHGVWMTPDHPVLSPEGWKDAATMAALGFPSVGQYSAAGQLLESTLKTRGGGTVPRYAASAAGWRSSLSRIFFDASRGSVDPVLLVGDGGWQRLSRTAGFVRQWSRGTRTSSPGATTPNAKASPTTVEEASRFIQTCKTVKHSYVTSSPSLAMTTSRSPSTGSTSTETTPPETSGSPLTPSRTQIDDVQYGRVYDLLNCGPRHRFQAGPLIVHNCEGWLTGCKYVREMFEKNIEADPYSAFGVAGFGVLSVKGEPLRDVVSKAAVLGYGYGMGKIRAMEELNKAVADPINKVSVQQIEALCHSRGWKPPTDRYLKGAISRTKCHWSVGIAAYEAREAFHAIHPEFFATADWLQTSVSMLSASKDPEYLIDRLYQLPGAPNRDMINLGIDKELEFPTIRVTLLGHSMPTVTWRQLSCSHPGVDGLGLITANKGPRNVHRALLIENVCQSAARIGLLRCENELARRGYLTDSVYDSILVICPREPRAILQARADLLDVMGPTGPHKMGWAFYAKPSEITVTKTRYEDEKEAAICFAKLEQGDPSWIDHLT